MGTVKLPVPVWRSGENFSPRPETAPPPFGREITWLETPDLSLMGPPHSVLHSPVLHTIRMRIRASIENTIYLFVFVDDLLNDNKMRLYDGIVQLYYDQNVSPEHGFFSLETLLPVW